MAEAFYNSLTSSNDATSAGATAEAKDHISKRAIEAMGDIGIDATNLKPKQLTEQMVERADRVVYFPSEYMPEYVKQSPKSQLWDVADPHYHKEQGMAFVYEVRDNIMQRVKKLVE